jgi:hypothetical protein
MTGSVELAAFVIANTCECLPYLIHPGADTGQSVKDRLRRGAMSSESKMALRCHDGLACCTV